MAGWAVQGEEKEGKKNRTVEHDEPKKADKDGRGAGAALNADGTSVRALFTGSPSTAGGQGIMGKESKSTPRTETCLFGWSELATVPKVGAVPQGTCSTE